MERSPPAQKPVHVHQAAYFVKARESEFDTQSSVVEAPQDVSARRVTLEQASREPSEMQETSPTLKTLYRDTGKSSEMRTAHAVAITLQQAAEARREETATGVS